MVCVINIIENKDPSSVCFSRFSLAQVRAQNKYLCTKPNKAGARHLFHFVTSSVAWYIAPANLDGIRWQVAVDMLHFCLFVYIVNKIQILLIW